MVNSVSAKRMLATRKILAVSTLGIAFFLLGAKADAAVISPIQRMLIFDSSPTGTVFLAPGETQASVTVKASSTLIATFETDSGGTSIYRSINFDFSNFNGGVIQSYTKALPRNIPGAGLQIDSIEHEFSQTFSLSPGTYTVTVGNAFLVDGKTILPPLNDIETFTVVPEPLTILGSGVALGFGALFKKEYSRKHKKVKILEKQKT